MFVYIAREQIRGINSTHIAANIPELVMIFILVIYAFGWQCVYLKLNEIDVEVEVGLNITCTAVSAGGILMKRPLYGKKRIRFSVELFNSCLHRPARSCFSLSFDQQSIIQESLDSS